MSAQQAWSGRLFGSFISMLMSTILPVFGASMHGPQPKGPKGPHSCRAGCVVSIPEGAVSINSLQRRLVPMLCVAVTVSAGAAHLVHDRSCVCGSKEQDGPQLGGCHRQQRSGGLPTLDCVGLKAELQYKRHSFFLWQDWQLGHRTRFEQCIAHASKALSFHLHLPSMHLTRLADLGSQMLSRPSTLPGGLCCVHGCMIQEATMFALHHQGYHHLHVCAAVYG